MILTTAQRPDTNSQEASILLEIKEPILGERELRDRVHVCVRKRESRESTEGREI